MGTAVVGPIYRPMIVLYCTCHPNVIKSTASVVLQSHFALPIYIFQWKEFNYFVFNPLDLYRLGYKRYKNKKKLSTVWVKKNPPPWNFLTFFPKRLGTFSPNFTRLLYVPIYAGLQIFIQLLATLTKLCHIKHGQHNVLKMFVDRNARWVVALNMA